MNPMSSGETSASSPVRPQPTRATRSNASEDEAVVMQRRAEDLARRVEEVEEIIPEPPVLKTIN